MTIPKDRNIQSASGQGGSLNRGGGASEADASGQDEYQYKGGRQTQSGVPSPDHRDDDKSAGSFRRTDEEPGADDDEDVDTDDEQDSESPQRPRYPI